MPETGSTRRSSGGVGSCLLTRLDARADEGDDSRNASRVQAARPRRPRPTRLKRTTTSAGSRVHGAMLGVPARRPRRSLPNRQLAPRGRFADRSAARCAAAIRNRSFAIAAVVDIPEAGAEGVLFAHGSRFGGHALYVKDNRLHYVNSFVGRVEQKIASDQELPTGEQLILSAAFDKEGEDPPGVSVGTLSLFHGDVKVGEGRIKTQPGKFSIGGEGLCVGRDSNDPVTDDYPGAAPHAFTGGTINRVAIDVSGEPYVDLEREAVAMMARE